MFSDPMDENVIWTKLMPKRERSKLKEVFNNHVESNNLPSNRNVFLELFLFSVKLLYNTVKH